MVEIKVKDINGNEIKGLWNEKTYNSKYENCVRIYVNNKEVHVNKSEFSEESLKEDKINKLIEEFRKLDMEDIGRVIEESNCWFGCVAHFIKRQGVKSERECERLIGILERMAECVANDREFKFERVYKNNK